MEMQLTFAEAISGMFQVGILFTLVAIYWELRRGARKNAE